MGSSGDKLTLDINATFKRKKTLLDEEATGGEVLLEGIERGWLPRNTIALVPHIRP